MSGAEDRPALLTDEQVKAIRERLRAATSGPWHRSTPNNIVRRTHEYGFTYIAEPMAAGNRANDADFIAHAPTDIAALLDDRDALVLRVVELSQQVADLENAWGPSGDDD